MDKWRLQREWYCDIKDTCLRAVYKLYRVKLLSGQACGAGSEGSGGSFLQFLIFVTTGVTCAAVLFDIANKYIFVKEDEKDKEKTKKGGDVVDGPIVASTASSSNAAPFAASAPTTTANATPQPAAYGAGEPTAYATGEPAAYATGEPAAYATGEPAIFAAEQPAVYGAGQPAAFSTPETSAYATSAPTAYAAPPTGPNENSQLPAGVYREGLLELAGKLLEQDNMEQTKPEFQGILGLMDNLVESLRAQVNLHEDKEDLPSSCAEKLTGIAGLELPCNTLACEFDQCSVALVEEENANDEQEQPEAEQAHDDSAAESFSEIQKRRLALKNQWGGIRRLFFCADVQLRNATAYQRFFYEAKELQADLDKFKDSGLNSLKDTDNDKDPSQASKEAAEVFNKLRHWDSAVVDLSERSRVIVPVHMRTEPVSEPIPVRALCSYKNKEFTVEEGESLILEDNEDISRWKVKNSSGEEGHLPAVTCLIPPPDKDAINAALQLRQSLEDSYDATSKLVQGCLALSSQQTLKKLEEKPDVFKVITSEHKSEILGQLDEIDEECDSALQDHKLYADNKAMIEELQGKVKDASEKGKEDKDFPKALDLIHQWHDGIMENKPLRKNSDDFKLYRYRIVRDEKLEVEEVEEEIEEEEVVEDTALEVNVESESTQFGEATGYSQASGEVSQTFSIRGVIDPFDETEISMADAIDKGIIDPDTGVYITKHGDAVPIPVAMNAGFIVVESTETKRARERKADVGIVTVTFVRETRPYTITNIIDPRSEDEISVDEAIKEGIFNPDTGRYRNPQTKEEMTIQNAIDCGALIVEYGEGNEGESEETTKTFSVYSVLDRQNGKRVSYAEAERCGLIDKEAGEYTDSLTGESVNLVEAFRYGWVKAKIVENSDNLDLSSITKTLSGSTDSLGSN